MRSTLPYDPRASLAPSSSLAGRLGRQVLDLSRRVQALLGTLGAAALSVRTLGVAAARTVRRVLLAQILYTGFQAVGLVSANREILALSSLGIDRVVVERLGVPVIRLESGRLVVGERRA